MKESDLKLVDLMEERVMHVYAVGSNPDNALHDGVAVLTAILETPRLDKRYRKSLKRAIEMCQSSPLLLLRRLDEIHDDAADLGHTFLALALSNLSYSIEDDPRNFRN